MAVTRHSRSSWTRKDTHLNPTHERTLGDFYVSEIILNSVDISPNSTFRKAFRFITAFCLAVKDLYCLFAFV